MATTSNRDFNRVMTALEDYGLLLASDGRLPSVAGIVAGKPIKGSWWAHPKCHEIFRINVRLEETGNVIVCKLISGKQTFVHRRLWPAIAAIGMSRERWQLNGLSPAARKLLKMIDDKGEVRTNVLSKEKLGEGKAISAATRELEQRLLVCAEDVHTDSGAHAKVLLSWKEWIRKAALEEAPLDPKTAKEQLESIVPSLNQSSGGDGTLPWLK